MKKAKKMLSIMLSVIVMIGALCNFNFIAYASVDIYDLHFGVCQYGQIISDGKHPRYGESFYKFTLTNYTTLKIDYDSIDGNTPWGPELAIINEASYDDYMRGKDVKKYLSVKADGRNDNYWYDGLVTLNKGTYYLVIEVGYDIENQEYSLIVTPTVNKVKNLKSSTTNNSVKLSWTGDMGAVGYQVQKITSDGYKTVETTTGTSCTIKDLSSAYTYKYRVRGYTKVDEETYYGSWSNITAITKPNKVSIKTPAANSKHQIIAKWNKVTRASGYQVQYCKNKSCSNVIATKTVSGQSKISYTGKNFIKNKTYYIRVRAYKTVNNTKYYGAWSSVKSIKCK